MLYTGTPTDWLNIPVPAAGDVSSAADEALRSNIPDWVLEIITKALTDENGDGTLGDGFQVSDDGGLNIEVSAGQGFIGGLVIEAAAPTAKANLTDNQLNYIFLKKTATTSADQSFTVEASLSSSMADAILIAAVTCAAGDITLITNTPTGRVPYIRDNPNPQIISDIPGLKVVAPSGGAYTSPKTAIEAASAGDVVYICPGIYTLTATITIPANNISIIGAGTYATILNNTTASNQTIIDLNGKSGISIRNLSITAHASNGYRAINEATACADLVIKGIYISGAGLIYGVCLNGADRATVGNCRVVIGGGSGGAAIACGGADILIQGNVIARSSGAAYGIYAYGDRMRIIANAIEIASASAWAAIYVRSGVGIAVIGNVIRVTAPAAVSYLKILPTILSCSDMIVMGNIVISTGVTGIGIELVTTNPYNVDNVLVNGNRLVELATGIKITDARVRYAMVHDNQYRGCTAGLSDAGTSTNATDNA